MKVTHSTHRTIYSNFIVFSLYISWSLSAVPSYSSDAHVKFRFLRFLSCFKILNFRIYKVRVCSFGIFVKVNRQIADNIVVCVCVDVYMCENTFWFFFNRNDRSLVCFRRAVETVDFGIKYVEFIPKSVCEWCSLNFFCVEFSDLIFF